MRQKIKVEAAGSHLEIDTGAAVARIKQASLGDDSALRTHEGVVKRTHIDILQTRIDLQLVTQFELLHGRNPLGVSIQDCNVDITSRASLITGMITMEIGRGYSICGSPSLQGTGQQFYVVWFLWHLFDPFRLRQTL